ncbi:MAG: hypothetical protein DMF61_11880 [Blastocatellia bacterium AA13]|nr:MAG: hypothetical protein DMF61_11880 [Blastocatellia bacterium AA13]
MKKLLLFLMGACLISTALAQKPTAINTGQGKVYTIDGWPTRLAADPNTLLFYQLRPELVAEGVNSLMFIVHEDGAIYMVERVALDPSDEGIRPSAPFLSADPVLAADFLEAAKKPSHHFRLMIRANGRVIRDFPFEEFLSYNSRLKSEASFHPVHVTTRMMLLKRPHEKRKGPSGFEPQDLTCTQECDVQYEACAEEACGDPHSICGPCLDAWNACRDACPPPPMPCPTTDPPTTQGPYLFSCTSVGGSSCQWSYSYSSNTYQFYGYCTTVTYTTTVTHNCNETTTSSVDTSYSNTPTGWIDTGEWCQF